jgi:hypothetical protein
MMAFLVNCECGLQVPVNEGSAGTSILCPCGQEVNIPSLRELRRQPQVTSSSGAVANALPVPIDVNQQLRHRIGMAIACLHISAVLYLVVGLAMFPLLAGEDDSATAMASAWFLLCLMMTVGVEFTVYGLKRRRFWGWVAGICIFAMYLPSLFLPLGALGLWGLLDEGSRRQFGVGSRIDQPHTQKAFAKPPYTKETFESHPGKG